MQSSCASRVVRFLGSFVAGACLLSAVGLNAQPVDPGCETYQAWTVQTNPRSDATGINNHAFPEYNATYWATSLNFPFGTVITIKGQYPRARYMSFQVYEGRNVVGAINDREINPDPGQNNPYRSGLAQGTYTIRVVFGWQPLRPAPNTIYTGNKVNVGLFYRIYYPNDPDDLPGGPVNPVLPDIVVNGATLASCPPRPIVTPEEATLSGRLDDIDFVGTEPPNNPRIPPPLYWQPWVTSPITPFYPSQDNSYLATLTSRDFLIGWLHYDMIVIRMKTPTFNNTQAGVPPYAPANMRFWSICVNEVLTTSVVRCIPDNRAVTVNGYATFVISDPSKRPSETVLSRWNANWLPWGALKPNDVIYNINRVPMTNADGVFYLGLILYRQTDADPNFAQSIENVSKLPPSQRPGAMGEYWPVIGYCRATVFEALGSGCVRRQ